MRTVERAFALVAAALLGACSLAPAYRTPPVPLTAHYREPGPWQPAEPADALPRDGWWQRYRDGDLDRLQAQLGVHNADLAAALAHYQQAVAIYRGVRAGLFPQIGINANAQRDRESDTRPLRGTTSPSFYNSFTLDAQLDYEIDLWGRVRDGIAAGNAEFAAAGADLANARLSLQASLADSVLTLRGLDRQIALLRQTIEVYEKALRLTRTRHDGGIASGLDVARAQTQLSGARSQLQQAQAQREVTEHAIAVLVGDTPSRFTLAPNTATIALPSIPTGVPSTLLQRRPDIAAAERRTAAANARVGVARAAFFPQVTLSAQGGFQSTDYGGLLDYPNRFWSIGPTLLLNLFDGGRRRAALDQAKAATDEAGARYRSVVLNAFGQVEDNLAQLNDLGGAIGDQRAAADAAQRGLDLSTDRYKQGAVSYLDVVTAQTAALDAQRALIDLQTRQLRASVQLVRALGGGWQRGDTQVANTR